MGAKFTSADDRVTEDDFKAVLDVLGGKSPWQGNIQPNIDKGLKNSAKHPFQIVDSKIYAQRMAAVGETGDFNSTPGVTDKKQGLISMLESFGVNSRAARFGHALHETVHLVSDPPGKAPNGHSSALAQLGSGLLEGLVEAVTEDILTMQGLKLARADLRGHVARVPVARALIKDVGVPLLGGLLFGGNFHDFLMTVNGMYSAAGWMQIKNLTTADHRDSAIAKMKELSAAQAAQNKIGGNQPARPALSTPAPICADTSRACRSRAP